MEFCLYLSQYSRDIQVASFDILLGPCRHHFLKKILYIQFSVCGLVGQPFGSGCKGYLKDRDYHQGIIRLG